MKCAKRDADEAWLTDIDELCYLGALGVPWSRMADSVAEAEQLPLLRIEQEEAAHRGRPFKKQDELQRAEKAMERVNLFRRFIGARVVARMAELADSLDDGPPCRFSDASIKWVFSHLHRWQIDPDDEEMQAAVRRFLWLGEHKKAGRGNQYEG